MVVFLDVDVFLYDVEYSVGFSTEQALVLVEGQLGYPDFL